MEFYDQLAETYDDMTRFEERLESERAILQKWIERYSFKFALDAACGTGLHAILLANMGIETVGADLSAKMLEKAKFNAQQKQAAVTWIESSFQELPKKAQKSFDVIFCLGNSIPHLLSQEELLRSLAAFHKLLNPGGHVVLQLLNYHRVLAERNRIVGIHRKNNLEFIRFLDFENDFVHFNILQITQGNDNLRHSLQSTTLYPYRQYELTTALEKTGFTEIEQFGTMKFSKFDAQGSPNLILVAEKGSAA